MDVEIVVYEMKEGVLEEKSRKSVPINLAWVIYESWKREREANSENWGAIYGAGACSARVSAILLRGEALPPNLRGELNVNDNDVIKLRVDYIKS